ncbi:hypothetical protein [Bacillus sp. NPDC094106]|uniref:hypothetical protein n=1 Tax=Bacillus sp. NPDC094106 TaxID=3363949 RepID=UPI0037F9B366
MELDNLFVVTKKWAEDNDCLIDDYNIDFESVANILNTNEFIVDLDSFKRELTVEEMKKTIQKAIDYLSTANDEPKVEKPCRYKVHYLLNGEII